MPSQTASEFLNKMKNLTKEELLAVDGIGDVLAENMLEFVNSDRHKHLVEEFEKLEKQDKGLTVKSKEIATSSELKGKIICITGKFDVSRDVIKEKVEAAGGKVTSAISNKTNILIAGKDAGSKLEKARSLGVTIIDDYRKVVS